METEVHLVIELVKGARRIDEFKEKITSLGLGVLFNARV
jgi:hypothetical protein